MEARDWRTAYASAIGTSHLATGKACQDDGKCEVLLAKDGSQILVAAVSDGAGSAIYSEEGARLTVAKFLEHFGPMAAEAPDMLDIGPERIAAWISDLRDEIFRMAEASENLASDYACTFLGVIVGRNRSVFAQIGDGAIVVNDLGSSDYDLLFWPQHGDYANTTYFVTQSEWLAALQVQVVETPVTDVAIFSDGIERLVLNFADRCVHSPTLRPIFRWLADTAAHSPDAGPSPGLVAFLSSAKVNARTDDDKTLVMATRARPLVLSQPLQESIAPTEGTA